MSSPTRLAFAAYFVPGTIARHCALVLFFISFRFSVPLFFSSGARGELPLPSVFEADAEFGSVRFRERASESVEKVYVLKDPVGVPAETQHSFKNVRNSTGYAEQFDERQMQESRRS